MKRFAVCTLTVGAFYERLASTSHETLAAYAEKCGADFHVETKLSSRIPGYSKLKLMRRLFNSYERVLFVDTDVLVRFDAPDLFDLVPAHKMAAFNEGHLFPGRRESKIRFLKESGYITYSDQQWTDKGKFADLYFNTGVLLASRCHADVFSRARKEVDEFQEQTHLNFRMYQEGADVVSLPYRFNRMICTLDKTGESFDDSFFAHFAGCFGNPETVDQNYDAWLKLAARFKTYRTYGKSPALPRRIFIESVGALGDAVATEPVVRFIREQIEPDADISIRARFPEVFAHLRAHPKTTILGPGDVAQDLGHLKLNVLPDAPRASFNWMHPVDYAALCTFNGAVPKAHRRIKLAVNAEAPSGIEDFCLVHPGKSWQSKTFPRPWWQAVIDGLRKEVPVALIGRTYPTGDFRGTVAVNPSGVLDLRNKTSLGVLFATIKAARVLVSNDSSPVHIAGAFETPVVMVTTAKNPDFIWPDRAEHLNISLGRPIKASRPSIGIVNKSYLHECTPQELFEALPEPDEVIAATLKAYGMHHARNAFGASENLGADCIGLRRGAKNPHRVGYPLGEATRGAEIS